MRFMVSAVLLTLLCAAVAAQSSRATATYVLDLLLLEVPQRRSRAPEAGDRALLVPAHPLVGSLMTTGSPSAARSLRVTLEAVDRFAYETGDSLVFEALVENIGTAPVVLPWSTDLALAKTRSLPGSRTGILYLEARSTHQRLLARLEGQSLFGTPTVDGSLQTLLPRETAWIRAPGAWRFDDYQRGLLLAEPEGRVHLLAVLILVDSSSSVRSANSIEAAIGARVLR